MKNSDSLILQHACSQEIILKPIMTVEKMKMVLQNPVIVSLTSIGDSSDKTISEKRGLKLVEQFKKNLEKYGLSFYEIYERNTFLGIAGYFCIHINNEMFPEVCIYLLPNEQAKGLGYSVSSFLIDNAFTVTRCRKVLADAYPENHSTKIINKLGFVQRSTDEQYKPHDRGYGQIKYELTREIRGLFLLTQIIQKENTNLIPRQFDMTKTNVERVRTLWYRYCNKGISLSNGGVSKSFINMDSIINCPNLESLHMYRSDRLESTVLTQDMMRKFLIEEAALSPAISKDIISISFCFGSHDGFARLMRCLYHPKFNNGIFYPTGGYGILSAAASTMRPLSYNVYLININRHLGEKVNVAHMRELFIKHPTSKTLFLDLKTTAGAVYTVEEVNHIIALCKQFSVFLIADLAHINMEFNTKNKFPEVASLCFAQNFHEFAILYTTSKTYGLERARVGFFILSKKTKDSMLTLKADRDLYRVIGAGGDISFEIASALFNSDLKKRKEYIRTQVEQHRYNLNLMIAYLEGTHSTTLDLDFKQKIKNEIPNKYNQGINFLKIVYKPESGIHLKVSTKNLKDKYFFNIPMFNAEIFSYAINKVCKVVSLNSYQIMDPEGFGLRLSFSIEHDVRVGMQSICDFMNFLSDKPRLNKFCPEVHQMGTYIFPSNEKMNKVILESYQLPPELRLFSRFKHNIKRDLPNYVKLSDKDIYEALSSAAKKIQFAWKKHSMKRKRSLLEKDTSYQSFISSKL